MWKETEMPKEGRNKKVREETEIRRKRASKGRKEIKLKGRS